jgi:hypothetical protein
MPGILDRIKELETEMARTQRNKATEYHLGQLKAKLAKLRTQLLEGPASSGTAGTGFDVQKTGHARVAMIGFPSVGKSTLLTKLTGTESVVAAYEFTTLTVRQPHLPPLPPPPLTSSAQAARMAPFNPFSLALTARSLRTPPRPSNHTHFCAVRAR